MLVYRGPDGGTHAETVPSTRRRKKSTGELFQKGYRVRMGHGQVSDKEDQDSICYSLGACFHVISYWGKTCRTREWGESPLKLEAGVSRGLRTPAGAGSGSGFALYYAPHLANAHLKWKTSSGEAHHGSRHFMKDYLFILFWLSDSARNVFDLCRLLFGQIYSSRGNLSARLECAEMDFTWLLTLGWGSF